MSVRSIFDAECKRVESIENVTRARFDTEIRPAGRPVILKKLVTEWPSVQASQTSIEALGTYLKSLDVGASTPTFVAPREVKGRYFYKPDMADFNFDRKEVPLKITIDQLMHQQDSENPVGIYAGASPTVNTLPQFGPQNSMPLVDDETIPKVWIGNSARIAPHFDVSENIACVVSGKRRFVIFPPEQVSNLYVGPIDYNMAGQPASMVDVTDIDLEQFPKFRDAMGAALIADLEPGDAIYIPSLWWHFVESKGPMNVLVNYWWDALENGSPMNVLALALLVLRDLPTNDRKAWSEMFQHYVFDEDAPKAVDHIPTRFQGVLGEKSPDRDAKIKAYLRAQLPPVFR